MKTKIIIFLIVIESILQAQNKLDFHYDYAQFEYDSLSNYLEIYYSFDHHKLVMQGDGTRYVEAIMQMKITNMSENQAVVNKKWKFKQLVKDTSEFNNSKITFGILRFIIPFGTYELFVSIKDNGDSTSSYLDSEKLVCKSFIDDKFKISDIQIAQNIIPNSSNKNSIFYKNTFEIIPNPAILYTEKLPVLYYYSELYNFDHYDPKVKISLTEEIINSLGEVVFSKSNRINSREHALVKVGLVNLKKFPTDAYVFILALGDSVHNRQYLSTKKFFLYNPAVEKDSGETMSSQKYIASEFSVYTDKECDRLFDESKYIATANEIEQYEKLDSLNAKREFLYKFWKKRDPYPETEVNEFKNEYMKRIDYCNSKFGAFNKEGYNTDRGRIYLKYGPPDEIDRYPNELNVKPYEIWHYQSIEGGVVFIFGDITGYSDYELLHSTKRGELQDENWQRRIRAR